MQLTTYTCDMCGDKYDRIHSWARFTFETGMIPNKQVWDFDLCGGECKEALRKRVLTALVAALETNNDK